MERHQLVELGCKRIVWAARSMPVVLALREELREDRPLAGVRVAACLHVTTETANLALTLAAAGAEVRLCASNPLSTQDDVAAALTDHYGIPAPSRRGEDSEQYYANIDFALDGRPNIVMDDGADLINSLHTKRRDLLPGVIAGTEETTTGVIRLRAMSEQGALAIPVVAVNDATTKHMFDNRYGTGQSSFDGIVRATNMLVAGSTAVIVGYGWCGRGLAERARGLGARVVVVEVDPLRGLQAAMDGFWVADADTAAGMGDLFITATGNLNVIGRRQLGLLRDGAILANAGHFNVEIDLPALAEMAVERREARPGVEEFVLADGRRICLLGEGRLVNLACAEGHPAQVMDMSFANQVLVVQWLVTGRPDLSPTVHSVPGDIDRLVAKRKLETMGIQLQELTDEQRSYLSSWDIGT